MSKEFEECKKIFDYLLAADKYIWEVVAEIRDNDIEQFEYFIKPLMQLRGEIHVEFMRPIYKKYPELAENAGFGDKEED